MQKVPPRLFLLFMVSLSKTTMLLKIYFVQFLIALMVALTLAHQERTEGAKTMDAAGSGLYVFGALAAVSGRALKAEFVLVTAFGAGFFVFSYAEYLLRITPANKMKIAAAQALKRMCKNSALPLKNISIGINQAIL